MRTIQIFSRGVKNIMKKIMIGSCTAFYPNKKIKSKNLKPKNKNLSGYN